MRRSGLAFHSAGGSFTYLEHAFVQGNVAGIAGWLLLAGYVGTMSLYASTPSVPTEPPSSATVGAKTAGSIPARPTEVPRTWAMSFDWVIPAITRSGPPHRERCRRSM